MYEREHDANLKGERLWALDTAVWGIFLGFGICALFGVPLAGSGIAAPFEVVGSIASAFYAAPFLADGFTGAAMGAVLGLIVGWVTADFAEPIECDETVGELIKKTYL